MEIGLRSLAELQRGFVLIEKNPNLCYVESIDRGRIGHSGRLNHFVQGNKIASECPKCPDLCPTDGDGRKLVGAMTTAKKYATNVAKAAVRHAGWFRDDHFQRRIPVCRIENWKLFYKTKQRILVQQCHLSFGEERKQNNELQFYLYASLAKVLVLIFAKEHR